MPIMAGHLGHIVLGLADTAMVGQLGEIPLAAIALANSVFMLFFVFAVGISMGITPLVASSDGKQDIGEGAGWLQNGLSVNMVTGLVMVLLTFGFTPFMDYLNQPPEVVSLAVPYLQILTLSVLPLMYYQHYKQFAEGLSFTKVAMYITVLTNLMNVGLNYLLIFGKLGFPRLELNGAGWATLISRVIMGLLMFLYVYKAPQFQQYWAHLRQTKLNWGKMKGILSIGIPIGFQYVLEVGAFVFAAFMIGWLGARELAAHQVALTLSAVTYMTVSGIAAATTVRIGNYFGQQDRANLKMAGNISFWLTGFIMGFFAVVFIVFRKMLPPLFAPDEVMVQEIATALLIIVAIYQLSDGLQVVGLGALRGMKDLKVPTYVTIGAYWGIGIPVGYLLGFKAGLGIYGVWYGLAIGLTLAAIAHILRFRYMVKVRV